MELHGGRTKTEAVWKLNSTHKEENVTMDSFLHTPFSQYYKAKRKSHLYQVIEVSAIML
jgi:hypothetical protein